MTDRDSPNPPNDEVEALRTALKALAGAFTVSPTGYYIVRSPDPYLLLELLKAADAALAERPEVQI